MSKRRSISLVVMVILTVFISGCALFENTSKVSPDIKRNITSLEDFNFKTDGWSVSGKWRKDKPLLDIQCRNSGKKDAVLSLIFPSMGPDKVKRFNLSGKKAEYKFTYSPPLKKGGNSYNRYVLKAKLKTSNEELTKKVVLAGKDSNFARLGAPLNTKYIKKSILGTNEHITFSRGSGRPRWAGWYDYKKLVDMMADAGIKWIRGFVGYGKDKQGNYKIGSWTLEWMNYAKSKNIKLIGQFYLHPKWTPEEIKKRCRAIANGTKGLINVFEVGNEPQNFAGWRKRKNGHGTYTGSWNGMEKDGSTAQWVKEYVKATNIAVEALRKARPDSIIIGLGSDPPVDHRMLDLGVSKEMDGIAEHPYSKRLVPERLPYGLPFEKRDKMRVGDEKCSFLGIMKDALRHSKKTGKERTLWLTEFGFSTCWYGAPKAYDQYGQTTENAQAIYTVRRFMQAMTMPEIKAACHYLFKDDTSNLFQAGANNCGLIRMDDSPKPAYYAVQRYASLFNNYEHDKVSKLIVEKTSSDAAHHKPINYVLWDDVEVHPEPGVISYAFVNPELPNERQIAVWSGRAVSGEWNSTFASIRVKGWKGFGNPVAVDLITGKTFDVPVKVDGDDLVLDLVLTDNPLVIKMFKKK